MTAPPGSDGDRAGWERAVLEATRCELLEYDGGRRRRVTRVELRGGDPDTSIVLDVVDERRGSYVEEYPLWRDSGLWLETPESAALLIRVWTFE
jgi:hypothetical protein